MDAEARPARLLVTYRARLLALAALGAYFAVVAALGGRLEGWKRVGVPADRLRFADLQNLTSSWECARRGIAVLPTNPCDYEHRPADFPRIWLLPSHLGLGSGDTLALGLAQGGLFLLAALLVLPAGASVKAGALYSLALCSPAVMLGLERENPDLTVFAIVVLGVLVAGRTAGRELAAAAIVLFAAILKLYPILALGLLVRRWTRTALVAAAAAAAGFAVYGLATLSYLRKMFDAIPLADTFSYGVRRASQWFSLAAEATVHGLNGYRAWDVALVAAAVVLGWFLARWLGPGLTAEAGGRDLDLFWAGACIYVGSYAVFRSNDYRLVFLLLTVPQLGRWAGARNPLAIATIAALLLTMWLDEWTGMPGVHVVLDWWDRTTALGDASFPLPVVVVAQYVLCTALIAWLLATFPLALGRLRRGSGASIVAAE